MAAALLSDTGGVATLVGDPPNLIVGSAAGIDFNTFLIHGRARLFAWLVIILILRWLFKTELAAPVTGSFTETHQLKNPRIWYASLGIMGMMVVLFTLHETLGWEP